MNDSITDSDIWAMVKALNPTITYNDSSWVISKNSVTATGHSMMNALYEFYNILINGN